MALPRAQAGLVEDLRDQTHVLVDQQPNTITGCDAGRLLAAVLQRIEPEVGQLGDVLARGPDSEDPAGVLRGFLAGKKIVGQSPIAACHMSQSPTARYADGPLRGWPAGRSSRPLVEQDGDETPDQHAKPGTDQPEEAQRGGCVIAVSYTHLTL